MAKPDFNFVDSSTRGFEFTWNARASLLRFGILPLMVKILLTAALVTLDWHENFLRAGLVLFPAYLMEGAFIAMALRYAVLGEMPGVALINPQSRKAMQAAMIVYALIKLCASFVIGYWQLFLKDLAPGGEPEKLNPGEFLIFLAACTAIIWGFRLLWLYVPAALGISMRHFLGAIKPYYSSFPMMGIWFLTAMPIFLGFIIITGVVGPVFGNPETTRIIALVFISPFFELYMAVVSSIAMGYSIQNVMQKKDK
jgi:hypothetical protein